MPSIFIWKSVTPILSQKTIRYYSGADWFLEESTKTSSYMYLNQSIIKDTIGDIIVYNVCAMPENWIGSELLEVSDIPYHLVKEDHYGKLEQLGVWMRFTLYNDDSITFMDIMKWLTTESIIEHIECNQQTVLPVLPIINKQYKQYKHHTHHTHHKSNYTKHNIHPMMIKIYDG